VVGLRPVGLALELVRLTGGLVRRARHDYGAGVGEWVDVEEADPRRLRRDVVVRLQTRCKSMSLRQR
jgi:hypothetical protein